MLRFATSLDYMLAIKCGRSLLIRPFLTALNTNTMYERIWSGFLLIRSVANWTLMRAFSRFFLFVVHKAFSLAFSCTNLFLKPRITSTRFNRSEKTFYGNQYVFWCGFKSGIAIIYSPFTSGVSGSIFLRVLPFSSLHNLTR